MRWRDVAIAGRPADAEHDCAARAIAIAAQEPYGEIAECLLAVAGRPDFSRGIPSIVTQAALIALRWNIHRGDWQPLWRSALPPGRLVVWVEPTDPDEPVGHVTAVVHGHLHDRFDCRAGLVSAYALPPAKIF